MTAAELREKYLLFFRSKGHVIISGASLIPQNDPTVLFTTAGMHPLVPYLLGEPHPAGRRLANCQKCLRTGDIDDVGDSFHLTFFEMLGNWSLGDYFKEEAITWSYEFLTSPQWLGFSPDRLWVTIFRGNESVPRDDESARIWMRLGIPESRIFALPMEDNWWGPAGKTGPCGPDTEMFIDTGRPACGPSCRPGCRCGRFFEVWNDVFLQYNKTEEGRYERLRQHNVDTGMGVERTVAMLQGRTSVFETELFAPIIRALESLTGRPMHTDVPTARAFRVIADHVRSATCILGDEQAVVPSNLGQGYVLRRLIRRAVRFGRQLAVKAGFLAPLAQTVVEVYGPLYPELRANEARILKELKEEEARFEQTLARGLAELEKTIEQMRTHGQTTLSDRVAFRLYDTFGFPIEFTEEIARENGLAVDRAGFEKAFGKHRELSRQSTEKIFKGGLADASVETTRLHTATHLLHQALRIVLGPHVAQRGSNITADRLRFDFSHPQKMTEDELRKVEALVNEVIRQKLPVTMQVMNLEQAKAEGAIALFTPRYGEQIKVYSVGDFSKEVCGGPHVQNTSELGQFRIIKEEACAAGIRRIRAVLEYPTPP